MIPRLLLSTTSWGSSYTVNTSLAYTNLLTSEYQLELLVMVMSYICGIVMIIRGFAMYKAFGQNINQASRPGEVAGPAVFIIVGTMLLYFPTIFNVGMYTLYGTTTPTDLAYTGTSTTTNWVQIYTLINRYCRLIGAISFFRGLVLISKSGDPGVQPGSITKGMIHLIAGLMIYNIGGTVAIIQYTFGISSSTT